MQNTCPMMHRKEKCEVHHKKYKIFKTEYKHTDGFYYIARENNVFSEYNETC